MENNIGSLFNENNPRDEEIQSNLFSFENLLSFAQITNNYNNKEEDNEKLTLRMFKERNLNKFKEDILFYLTSPETLLNFKRNKEEETNY